MIFFTRMNAIIRRVKKHDKRITTLETKLQTLKNRIVILEGQVQDHETRITALE